jgi:hypothetical protein
MVAPALTANLESGGHTGRELDVLRFSGLHCHKGNNGGSGANAKSTKWGHPSQIKLNKMINVPGAQERDAALEQCGDDPLAERVVETRELAGPLQAHLLVFHCKKWPLQFAQGSHLKHSKPSVKQEFIRKRHVTYIRMVCRQRPSSKLKRFLRQFQRFFNSTNSKITGGKIEHGIA